MSSILTLHNRQITRIYLIPRDMVDPGGSLAWRSLNTARVSSSAALRTTKASTGGKAKRAIAAIGL